MGDSIYTSVIKDKRAVYFSYERAGCNEGEDVTVNLQQTIDKVKKQYGYGIVYVEPGQYLLSGTIYVPKAIRIIGCGKEKPKFILQDNASNFDKVLDSDEGEYRYLFWFIDQIVTDENGLKHVEDANPGTFYSAMSNVDIDLGHGNKNAVALRTHYAQHSFISHVDINVGDAMAGIYDVGNEMEHIHIIGGEYAIITKMCSPGWPFIMLDTVFENQRTAAIKTHEAGLTIVRNKTSNVPLFMDVDQGYFEKVYMENCELEGLEQVLCMDMDTNALTQVVIKNCYIDKDVVLAKYRDSDRCRSAKRGMFDYMHGTIVDEKNHRKIVDEYRHKAKDLQLGLLKSDIVGLPDVSTWTDVTEYGLKGDGITDNSEKFNALMDEHDTLYFPQGDYLFDKEICLKPGKNIIGMHPYCTKFILKENSEEFTGFGEMKPFLRVMPGRVIINGIGLDTGGRNPRATAILWQAGEYSLANDIKIIGGHGNLEPGTGEFINPYNETRTADAVAEKQWDAQYPSFVVHNGGGTFKDIWTASPYSMAGFEVNGSHIPSNVYCISLEHHQRDELIIRNSSNWNFYALQTEEEVAEGEYALPIEIRNSRDITFNMSYFFRTVYVKTPSDYCVKVYESDNIEFNCMNNATQVKYTFGNFIYDVTKDRKVGLWQVAKVFVGDRINRDENNWQCEVTYDESQIETRELKILKKYEGFRFADGGTTDSKGNFYFLDSTDKRVYRVDKDSLKLELVLNSPIKVNSLAVDTMDNLIGVGEYIIPSGATEKGREITNVLPVDSYGTSYGYWYNPNAVVTVFAIKEGRIEPLEKIKDTNFKPEMIIYPGNRWRDGADFEEMLNYRPEFIYVMPDEVSIMPDYYDLIRANNLAVARPGQLLYSVDERYKRVYAAKVDGEGNLKGPRVVCQQGDYCVRRGKNGIYVGEDAIKYYKDGDMFPSLIYKIPERPTTFGLDTDGNLRYVTTTHKMYVVEM